MADGKLYIIVTDQLPGGQGEPLPDESKTKNGKKDSENPVLEYAKHQFFSLVKSQAKQVVNASISNIGNFTGDYVQQQQTSNVINAMSSLIDIGMSVVAGVKMGGPVGGLVALGVSGTTMGVSQGLQLYAGYQENARQNRAISILRTRAGLNSTNNGSRGTEQ